MIIMESKWFSFTSKYQVTHLWFIILCDEVVVYEYLFYFLLLAADGSFCFFISFLSCHCVQHGKNRKK